MSNYRLALDYCYRTGILGRVVNADRNSPNAVAALRCGVANTIRLARSEGSREGARQILGYVCLIGYPVKVCRAEAVTR